MSKHIPVLLREVTQILTLKPGMTVLDATLGGGGYGKEIVKKIAPNGIYIGIDRDAEAVRKAEVSEWVVRARKKGVTVHLFHKNFSEIEEIVRSLEKISVDAIVADLGISSDQLEDAERGLSFLKNGPLDMRLDRSESVTAKMIVNEWSVGEIARVLRENAEEANAGRIAEAILRRRGKKPIETTGELVEIVREVTSPKYLGKKINPATKTFMALRMAVNKERKSLEGFLEHSVPLLSENGKMAVVTFHSGEDILVKKFFRNESLGCVCPTGFPVCRCGQAPKVRVLTKRAIAPTEEEVQNNPRSRSAKLRAVEKM